MHIFSKKNQTKKITLEEALFADIQTALAGSPTKAELPILQAAKRALNLPCQQMLNHLPQACYRNYRASGMAASIAFNAGAIH